MAKKSTPPGRIHGKKIPAEQLDLPITFDAAGKLVTLREIMAPGHGSVLTFASLTPKKRAELTAKRIEAQPKFEVAMVGGGIVDKERAIEEVKAQTDIGQVLTEIEERVINNLLEQVADK